MIVLLYRIPTGSSRLHGLRMGFHTKCIVLFGKTILFLLRTDVLVFRCHHTNSPKRFGIHREISIAKIRHGFKKICFRY